MQQKRTLLTLHFKKISYLRFFLIFSAKRVLCPLGHISNKVIRGIVQKPDEVRT